MTIDYLSTAGLFFSVLTWQTTATPELVLFSQWLLLQSYFTPREEGAQKPSCRGLAGPVTNFMCRQFIRQLFGVRLFYHRSHFDLCLGRLKSGNVGGNSCHVPTVAWGLRTGTSKINVAKFSDACSVRANWLCMGWPFCLAEIRREFQTGGNFFCTTA